MRLSIVIAALLSFALGLAQVGRLLADEPPALFDRERFEAKLERSARSFRPVGTTSLVYRVDLSEGERIAFRPRQRYRLVGHLAELAAYRIGEALGIETIPPVALRLEPLHRLDRLMDARFAERHQEERDRLRPIDGGQIIGAAIDWVPDLTASDLDRPEVRARWLEALQIGAPSSEEFGDEFPASILRDLSNLVVYDYLIGNWDRMSGGNLQTNADGTRVYLRDHNLAFDTPTPRRHELLMLERLDSLERFDRGVIRRLAELNREALERVLEPDPLAPETPILNDAQIDDLMNRRARIFMRLASLFAVYGELIFELPNPESER